jgi:hypothetical protein
LLGVAFLPTESRNQNIPKTKTCEQNYSLAQKRKKKEKKKQHHASL